MMDFPRLVYRSAAEHTVAADKKQFDALCEDGWYATVPEAIAAETAPTSATTASTEPTAAKVAPAKGSAKVAPAQPWAKG